MIFFPPINAVNMPNWGYDMRGGQYPKNPVDCITWYEVTSTLSKGVIRNEKQTTHLLQQKGNKTKTEEQEYIQLELCNDVI